jgi:hypothetical protein
MLWDPKACHPVLGGKAVDSYPWCETCDQFLHQTSLWEWLLITLFPSA